VGPFRPALFFSLDDLEFGLRLRRADWRLYAYRPPRSELWRAGRIKRTKRRIGLRIHLEEPDWRSYYSLRNLIHILRLHHRVGTAVRVTVVRGLLKPVVNLPVAPGRAVRNLRMNVRACGDAWRGRMGRTVEPPVGAGPEGSP
jgi:GT2 family glycosyltransferase